MPKLVQHSSTMAFIALIGLSLIVGWCMPNFYEWTGSDQSRPSPLLWQVPIGAGVAVLAFSCILPWLPLARANSQTRSQGQWRFGLRSLLLLTMVIAVAILLFGKFPTIAGGMICMVVMANLIRVAINNTRLCLPAIALLSCMMLPYAWVIHYDERDRVLSHFFLWTASWPTFFPAAYLSGMLGQDFRESPWISMLLTAIELGVGTWLIGLGPRRTIAFSLFALLTAAMGSLGFYQLCIF